MTARVVKTSDPEPTGRRRSEPSVPAGVALSCPRLRLRLAEPRSAHYVLLVCRLDDLERTFGASAPQVVAERLAGELSDLATCQHPIALVGRCGIGGQHDVHACDLIRRRLEHFRTGNAMSPLFERARTLALDEGRAFIEIYVDRLCTVSADGTVAVIEG